MIICIAENYQEFEKWRDERVIYVGDERQLELIDPNDVRDIRFVGKNFRNHPIYFSDKLLEFQMNVALAKRGEGEKVNITKVVRQKPWYKRILGVLS